MGDGRALRGVENGKPTDDERFGSSDPRSRIKRSTAFSKKSGKDILRILVHLELEDDIYGLTHVLEETVVNEFRAMGYTVETLPKGHPILVTLMSQKLSIRKRLLADLNKTRNKGPVLIVEGKATDFFISRMGPRSVWHEAQGQFKIFDSRDQGEYSTGVLTAKEVGVGDPNAGHKALRSLADELAQKIKVRVALGALKKKYPKNQ